MEGRTVSLFNSVPSFAQGSDILLVHNDKLSLGYLSSLLRQCSFKVTATNQATAAIDMVCHREGKFKLVMAKANMPDMSTLSFLNKLLLKDIIVIFISSGQNDGAARAALDEGLCYLLEEPIQPEDLIFVWQQVYHPNNNLAIHNAKSKEKVHESSGNQERTHHGVRGKKRGKRAKLGSHQMNLDNNYHTVREEGDEMGEHNNDRSSAKRPRISWTPDLHYKFVHAISVLGEKNSRPKEILQMMDVPNLTCRQIASHLQKFKYEVRRLQDFCVIDLPPVSNSSNFSGRTKSPSSFASQSYTSYPTLADFLSENQNLNQFPWKIAETKGQENFQQQETPGYTDCSFQYPTELVNYGNQDLEAVVRGALPKYNNISKFLGEDSDKYDCFENGLIRDDTTRNFETLKNSIFGNSSSSQKSDDGNHSHASPVEARTSSVVRGPEPEALTNQSQTLTEHSNILKILGEDRDGNDCFGNGPDDITQNYEILKSSSFGNSSSSQQSDSPANLLKARSSAIVEGPESDALTDQNQNLTEYNGILKSLGEGYDCFGKVPYAQNFEMLRNSILGNNFGVQQSDNYNPSCLRFLKSKPYALKDENEYLTELSNIPGFTGEDIAQNSQTPRNSISDNSVSFLKAKPCAVVGGTVPDALTDHDKTQAEYDISSSVEDDSDKYGCFGNELSPNDMAI